jgi:hypothetical protein
MFSEIVDTIVARSGRPESQADIEAYVNQVIRESRARSFFFKDLTDDTIDVLTTPVIWPIPRLMRRMQAVKYQSCNIYPKYIAPGAKQKDYPDYFYAAGQSYVFTGRSLSVGETIAVSYYTRPITYKYYAVTERPAVYNTETGVWTYLTATTDDEQEAVRNLVSDWLMIDWQNLVEEGALAAIYGLKGDQRGVVTYSRYRQLLTAMIGEEVAGINHAAQGV